MALPGLDNPDLGKRTMAKVLWRLMPFLMLLYVVNVLDRSNLGYVALDMNDELAIDAIAFGALAAAFYLGYIFFEVPSNIMLEKFGANKIISRIMISWGIVTILMFFVQEYWQMYSLRVLLGIMEAGFFPGIIFYLAQWVPPHLRARAVTFFFVGSQVGTALSAPLATTIMDHVDLLGVSGWRWVFVVEGVPAIILGVVAFFFLSNQPKDAKWLQEDEKAWLMEALKAEKKTNKTRNRGAMRAFMSLRVWHLAMIYLLFQAGTQAMSVWSPTIVKSFSDAFSNTTIGIILMVPSLIAILFMLYMGRRSDKQGERKFHALVPLVLSVLGLIIAASSDNVYLQITGIIVFGASYPAFYGIFWTFPTIYLTGAEAAVGIAIINSTSSASTFGASWAIGFATDSYGSTGALILTGAFLTLSILFLLGLRLKDAMLQQQVRGQSNESLDELLVPENKIK